MTGRTYSSSDQYRYSINGQEKTPEIAPNTTTAEFWQYDSRIVRRWNVDPVVKENESPYMVFSGNPVWLTDYNGADTTLPKIDGGNATVSSFTTFDGSSHKLKGFGNTVVTPAAGTLNTFTTGGLNFQSEFNSSTGDFMGYYTTDGKHLSYLDYSSQLAASSKAQMAGAGALTLTGTGSAGRTIAQPSPFGISTIGYTTGAAYGSTHADKIQDWCLEICEFFGADVPISVPITIPITAPRSKDRNIQYLYELKAANNGWYPNYSFGSAMPIGYRLLKAGDTWKYGTSIDPDHRYSLTYLITTG